MTCEAKWTDYKISFCSNLMKLEEKTFSQTFDDSRIRQEVVNELIAAAEKWKKQSQESCKDCNKE